MKLHRSIALALLTALAPPCLPISLGADEPLPSPTASKQVVPRGNASVGAPEQPNIKPSAQPAGSKVAPDGKSAKDAPKDDKAAQRRPLIAPPSMLLRAPTLARFTAPGLGKLDLNRASLEQLQRLPGVGLTWAPRILAGRPYRTMGDLARDGIPFTTIDSLSDQVELGP